MKRGLGLDHGVMPVEALWWADDMSTFTVEDESNWSWTAMITSGRWTQHPSQHARRTGPLRGSGSINRRVGMVVHMALPLVLLLGILLSLVIMLHGRVVVLVTVDRRQVLPGGPVSLVVDHVRVRMRMNHRFVLMYRHDSFWIEPIRLGGTSSRAEGPVQSRTHADAMARRRSGW